MNKETLGAMTKLFALRLQQVANQTDAVSLRELAKLTGIGRSCLSNYLSAKQLPTAKNLILLAQNLNCSCDWLLGISEVSQHDK